MSKYTDSHSEIFISDRISEFKKLAASGDNTTAWTFAVYAVFALLSIADSLSKIASKDE